jgi:small conductance mechanosensitive channel
MPFDINALFQNEVFQTVLHIVAAIAVFFIGRWLAQRARTAASIGLSKTPLPPSMTRLILLVVYYGLLAIMLMVILALIGFPVESLLVPALLIAVILGLALQQSIANLAATVMFMLFQPFKVGEVIKSNGVLGTVREIQFFSVVLLTGDNVEITLPSSKIQGDTLQNYTRQTQRRADFVFGVGYQDDIQHVKQVLHDLLTADPRVLTEPAPQVFVQELADSSVNVAVRVWVKTADYWPMQWDLPERVKLRFDAEGISIPFPQRDVHLVADKPIGA